MPQCDPNCCMAIGANAKLAVDFAAAPDDVDGVPQPRTFSDSSLRFDFLAAQIVKQRRTVGNRTIHGTLDDLSSRSKEGASLINGRIAMQGSPKMFDTFLRAVLGKKNKDANGEDLTPSAGTSLFHPNCLESFDLLINHDDQAVQQFVQLYINKMVIRCRNVPSESEPEIVQVFMDVFGKRLISDATWPDPAPTLAGTEVEYPYTMSDSTLTLGDDDIVMATDAWTLEIDRGLQVKWRTNVTPTCIFPTQNKVTLSAEVPLCADTFDVLHETIGAGAHFPGSLDLSLANTSTLFEFVKLENVGPDPVVEGKEETMHLLELKAYADVVNDEPTIVVTSDVTTS